MPIYEYRCQGCGERVSIRHGINDDSKPSCPLCHSENLLRLISRVFVVKSAQDRTRDLSWVDKDFSRRIKKKAGGNLSPAFRETLDWMDPH